TWRADRREKGPGGTFCSGVFFLPAESAQGWPKHHASGCGSNENQNVQRKRSQSNIMSYIQLRVIQWCGFDTSLLVLIKQVGHMTSRSHRQAWPRPARSSWLRMTVPPL